MNVKSMAGAFASISGIMTENKDYLVELDQQNGDGDLGIYMDAGFKAVSDYIAATEETDLGKIFLKLSGIFNETAPSSLGTIISIGLMGMAKSLKGKTDAGIPEIAGAMETGIAAIMEKAKSKPGEKTILDSLCPGIEVLKYSGSQEEAVVWANALEAASKGSESTKDMKSVHGRAAYYAEKSIGILDGGSVVGKLIFEGICKKYKS